MLQCGRRTGCILSIHIDLGLGQTELPTEGGVLQLNGGHERLAPGTGPDGPNQQEVLHFWIRCLGAVKKNKDLG